MRVDRQTDRQTDIFITILRTSTSILRAVGTWSQRDVTGKISSAIYSNKQFFTHSQQIITNFSSWIPSYTQREQGSGWPDL